jgi:hypothetical protein
MGNGVAAAVPLPFSCGFGAVIAGRLRKKAETATATTPAAGNNQMSLRFMIIPL